MPSLPDANTNKAPAEPILFTRACRVELEGDPPQEQLTAVMFTPNC